MSYNLTIAQLRYTKAQFIATNPVPLSGQLCIETDTNTSKVGDGSTAYASLPERPLSGEERTSADDVWAARRLTKVAILIATQNDTDPPVVDRVLANDFGVSATPSYDSVGQYSLTFTGASFTDSNATVSINKFGVPRPVGAAIITDGVVAIHTQDTSFSYSDSIIDEGVTITITQYQ